MTRLAVGPAADPQLPPLFVTAGRAAVAGLLSIGYLALTAAPRPRREQWAAFAVCAAGTVVGFPLCPRLRVAPCRRDARGGRHRRAAAGHGTGGGGVLPPASVHRLLAVRARRLRAGARPSRLARAAARLGAADALLLLAVASASIGYVAGARLSTQMRAEQVICWVLVLALPLTLPVMLVAWPEHAVRASAWGGFAYVTLFSMWLGFFAWYRGLALGGAVRVSQVQLCSPSWRCSSRCRCSARRSTRRPSPFRSR